MVGQLRNRTLPAPTTGRTTRGSRGRGRGGRALTGIDSIFGQNSLTPASDSDSEKEIGAESGNEAPDDAADMERSSDDRYCSAMDRMDAQGQDNQVIYPDLARSTTRGLEAADERSSDHGLEAAIESRSAQDAEAAHVPTYADTVKIEKSEKEFDTKQETEGFNEPKSPIKSHRKSKNGPKLSGAKYFPEWLSDEEPVDENDPVPEHVEIKVEHQTPVIPKAWSEYENNEDLGEIPPEWKLKRSDDSARALFGLTISQVLGSDYSEYKRDMDDMFVRHYISKGQKEEKPKLAKRNNNVQVEEIIDKGDEQLYTAETRERILNKEKKRAPLDDINNQASALKQDQSDYLRRPGRYSIPNIRVARANVGSGVPGSSKDKGKEVDPREHGNGTPNEMHTDIEENDEDEDVRTSQIKADHRFAKALQERLNEEIDRTEMQEKELQSYREHFGNISQAAKDEEARSKDQRPGSRGSKHRKLKSRKGKSKRVRHRSHHSSPDSSPSSSSTDSSSESDTSSSSESESDEDRKTRKRKAKNHKRNEKRRSRAKSLKPSAMIPQDSRLKATMGNDPSDSSESSDSESSRDDRDGCDERKRRPKPKFSKRRSDISDSGSSDESDRLFPTEPSSSDSADDEDAKKSRKRALKKYRKKMAKAKHIATFLMKDPPMVYKGEEKVDLIQKWMRSIRDWKRASGMKTYKFLRTIGKYIEGKPYNWYAREVLHSSKRWTMHSFFNELFDECFGESFITEQRLKFSRAKQEHRELKDFIQYLRNIADITGQISDKEIVFHAFLNCDERIRAELRRDGHSENTMKLKKFIRKGFNIETALGLRDRKKKSEKRSSDVTKGGSGHANGGRKSQAPQSNQSGNRSRGSFRPAKNNSDHGSKPGNTQGKSNGQTQKNKFSLDAETKERYKKEGRCYKCGSKDHISKDCPEGKFARPPKINSNSVTIDSKASELKSAAFTLNLNAVRFNLESDQQPESYEEFRRNEMRILNAQQFREAKRLVLITWLRYKLRKITDNGPLEFDNIFPSSRKGYEWSDPDRFLAYFGDDDIIIVDGHTNLIHTFGLSDFRKRSVNLHQMLYYSTRKQYNKMANGSLGWKGRWPSPYLQSDGISNALDYETFHTCFDGSDSEGSEYWSIADESERISDARSDGATDAEDKDSGCNSGSELSESNLRIWTESVKSESDSVRPWLDSDGDSIPALTSVSDTESSYSENAKEDSNSDDNCSIPGLKTVSDSEVKSDIDTDDSEMSSDYFNDFEEMFEQEHEPVEQHTGTVRHAEFSHLSHNRSHNSNRKAGCVFNDEGAGLQRMKESINWLENVKDLPLDTVKPQEMPMRMPFNRFLDSLNDLEREALFLCGTNMKNGMHAKKKAKADINEIDHTSLRVKDFERKVPKPLVIMVKVNGHPVRAMIDSGSMADFISSTVVDQLKLPYSKLAVQVPVQLAVSGSRTKLNYACDLEIEYQDIKAVRHFDVANLDSYDMILGTPFLYQHAMLVGFNPFNVTIGSVDPRPLEGAQILTVGSAAATVAAASTDKLRKELMEYARPICKSAEETPLPPLRAINHRIPLIDEHKVYPYRPSKCPEPLKPIWKEKVKGYIKNGRWEYATGGNALPMLILKKPDKGDGILRVRSALDARFRNANTRKMASPLPEIDTIVRNVARHSRWSALDCQDAFEQIRVEPGDVWKTIFTTPEGTMVSHVIQQGDCNAGATFQALMTHILAPYIGIFLDVYLDDIVIYSDSDEDHMKHVKLVIDILRAQQIYLSERKLHFFVEELSILGHIIDHNGIKMDPAKVDKVTSWKTPVNKEQLSSFIGAVGFLAPGCEGIRIPMGTLSAVAAPQSRWTWGPTQQRAFDDVRHRVQLWRDEHRIAPDYSPGAPPINLTTDASLTGASGVLSQGTDIHTARVIAFWSGKFTTTQQNYPVHEQELLAIVSSLKRFRDLLHGTHFRIFTDHEALQVLGTQKHLSPRQARWLEVLADFDYSVTYLPGEQNILADSLSRIYSAERKGTVPAPSEYVPPVDEDDEIVPSIEHLISAPVTVGETIRISPRLAERLAIEQAKREIAEREKARAKDATAPMTEPRKRKPRSAKPKKAVARVTQQPEGEKSVSSGSAEKLFIRIPARAKEQTENGSVDSSAERSTIVPTPDQQAQKRSEGPSPDDVRRASNEAIKPISHPLPITEEEELLSAVSPTLIDLIAAGAPAIEIPKAIQNKYGEDKFFKTVLEKPKDYKNFEVRDGLIFLKDSDRRILCIPDVRIGERRVREIVITHAHSILAHLGARKTLHYLKDNVWWKDMIDDVKSYCESCSLCQTTKAPNHKPYGLLHTLDVPTRPWESIGVDFVGPLPESKTVNGTFDMLMVIIDHLTSMVHLIPIRSTFKAKEIAEVIFDRVYKHHGLPRIIVSDRDSYFTSIFWDRLHALLGTELRMSSAYHPESDGSTERANRTVTTMIRQCVEPAQRDWALKLPGIEFAINSARSETTGYTPFFLNSGQMPRSMIWNVQTEYPGVRVFAQRVQDAVMAAHDSILHARVKQTRVANGHRKPSPFSEGDLVYLSTKNISIPKGRARKLIPKYIGPYEILKDFGNESYKLALPDELKQRGVHSTFHASLLRIHVPNDDRRFPGRQMHQVTGLGKTDQWAVKRVVSHRGNGKKAYFEIEWSTGDRSWMPYHEVSHLNAFADYLEALDIPNIGSLKGSSISDIPLPELNIQTNSEHLSNVGATAKEKNIMLSSNAVRLQKARAPKSRSSHQRKPNPPPRRSNSIPSIAQILAMALNLEFDNVQSVRYWNPKLVELIEEQGRNINANNGSYVASVTASVPHYDAYFMQYQTEARYAVPPRPDGPYTNATINGATYAVWNTTHRDYPKSPLDRAPRIHYREIDVQAINAFNESARLKLGTVLEAIKARDKRIDVMADQYRKLKAYNAPNELSLRLVEAQIREREADILTSTPYSSYSVHYFGKPLAETKADLIAEEATAKIADNRAKSGATWIRGRGGKRGNRGGNRQYHPYQSNYGWYPPPPNQYNQYPHQPLQPQYTGGQYSQQGSFDYSDFDLLSDPILPNSSSGTNTADVNLGNNAGTSSRSSNSRVDDAEIDWKYFREIVTDYFLSLGIDLEDTGIAKASGNGSGTQTDPSNGMEE